MDIYTSPSTYSPKLISVKLDAIPLLNACLQNGKLADCWLSAPQESEAVHLGGAAMSTDTFSKPSRLDDDRKARMDRSIKGLSPFEKLPDEIIEQLVFPSFPRIRN